MGLSALQARLLLIVSRMNDVAAQQSHISEAQADLARQSEEISREYSEAMSNTKLVIQVESEGDTFSTKTKDLDYSTMSQQGYLAVTVNDEIMLQKDSDGNWIIPKDVDGNELIEITDDGKAIIKKDTSDEEGYEPKKYDLKDGSKYLSDTTSINNALLYGALYLLDTNNLANGKITTTSIATTENIQQVLDTSDDAAAQSKYQYETARIARIDNQYDIEEKKLETEATALSKEYESITKAIDKNVERTFGLFENG